MNITKKTKYIIGISGVVIIIGLSLGFGIGYGTRKANSDPSPYPKYKENQLFGGGDSLDDIDNIHGLRDTYIYSSFNLSITGISGNQGGGEAFYTTYNSTSGLISNPINFNIGARINLTFIEPSIGFYNKFNGNVTQTGIQSTSNLNDYLFLVLDGGGIHCIYANINDGGALTGTNAYALYYSSTPTPNSNLGNYIIYGTNRFPN